MRIQILVVASLVHARRKLPHHKLRSNIGLIDRSLVDQRFLAHRLLPIHLGFCKHFVEMALLKQVKLLDDGGFQRIHHAIIGLLEIPRKRYFGAHRDSLKLGVGLLRIVHLEDGDHDAGVVASLIVGIGRRAIACARGGLQTIAKVGSGVSVGLIVSFAHKDWLSQCLGEHLLVARETHEVMLLDLGENRFRALGSLVQDQRIARDRHDVISDLDRIAWHGVRPPG